MLMDAFNARPVGFASGMPCRLAACN